MKISDICNLSWALRTSVLHPAKAAQERKCVLHHQGPAEIMTSMTSVIIVTKDDIRGTERQRRKDVTLLRLAYLWLTSVVTSFHLYFHMVAERQQLHHHDHHRRTSKRGEEKGETSGEETMTSPSHLGSQCSTNIGAPQHDHYHYDQCTSCQNDSSEDGDILATCLHLYDVDIKDGTCYMLNLPQPRLPTPTVFDGTSPTFPEWARELRAYLNISQFEHINLFDFALRRGGTSYNRHHGASDRSRSASRMLNSTSQKSHPRTSS